MLRFRCGLCGQQYYHICLQLQLTYNSLPQYVIIRFSADRVIYIFSCLLWTTFSSVIQTLMMKVLEKRRVLIGSERCAWIFEKANDLPLVLSFSTLFSHYLNKKDANKFKTIEKISTDNLH